ncbi:MAG: DOPA 4,5-dioxygenase family protein [Caulobacter sp.]
MNWSDERAKTDQDWAKALAPSRRGLLGVGLAAGLASPSLAAPASKISPWGADTFKQPTPAPASYLPGGEGLPAHPRAFTDIESYHAHIYFDEDTYQKAALIRRWAAERFEVELGDWNLEPRGPHVTPSFYFGFTNEQLATIVPWLQLNSLGLTILLHPNTDDPRADHLYYALWVNRAQPVNAYAMKRPGPGQPAVEQIIPNTVPSVPLERG